MANGSFFSELRKRKVLQAAAIYGAVAWGVTEVVVTVVEQLFLPQWVATLAVIGFVVGFPIAMFLSWTFDITADGIERTEVSSRRGKASIALSFVLLIAGTAGLFLLIKPAIQEPDRGPPTPEIAPNSIAVLPFDNVGRDPDDEYLSEGLSDGLRNQLSRVVELRVAARSSSIVTVTRGMDAITASASLAVRHILEGRIRRQGNRLHISVELIEGSTGLALWSDSYQRNIKEFVNVQQTIAEEVVRRVLPGAVNVATAPATYNPDANELLLLAQSYENDVRSREEIDEAKLLKAINFYRAATKADPESALAHSRLARALLFLGDLESAEAAIDRAMQINPNLSEVQNTLGETYLALRLPEAVTAFRRAVELDPDNADALANYAYILWLTRAGKEPGNPESGDLFRQALENDRLSLKRYAAFGNYLGRQGRAKELPPVIEDIQRLFDNADSYRAIGRLHELMGEVDHAIAWTLRARDLEPDNPDHNANLAGLFALLGDEKSALQFEPEPGIWVSYLLRRYEELVDVAELVVIEDPNDIDARYLLGFAYVATDRYDQAIRILYSTGLPDSALNDLLRSTTEGEAFGTLIMALVGSDIPEAKEAGLELARWIADYGWWGDIGWIGLYRSCTFAILGERQRALEYLPQIKDSVRLRRPPEIHDSWCFRDYQDEPVYKDVVADQKARRKAILDRLPETLADYGVSL